MKKNLKKKLKSFIAIIPARGNSQRIKNKNIAFCNGKPLIYWTIKAAKKLKFINNICVTSDSEKILKYCSDLDIEIVRRPKKISGNIVMPDIAIQHAYLKLNQSYDYIVMLQPTSPLRSSDDIDKAIETILIEKSDSLFSSSIQTKFIWKKINKNHKPINYNINKRPRSQDICFFAENGAIYITKSKLFLKNTNRLGGKISTYVMESDKSIDIDKIEDLDKVKILMNK